jgi:hypothetical protein
VTEAGIFIDISGNPEAKKVLTSSLRAHQYFGLLDSAV